MAEPESGGGTSPASAEWIGAFDPSKIAERFSALAKEYKLPGVDIDALVAHRSKNIEALKNANRIALEGMQALTKRQGEIFQETMSETFKAVDAVSKSGSPQDAVAKEVEIAKQGFERALDNMQELAQMMNKASEDATNVINARISETLDEIKELALKMKE
jgi:phasin family protein